MAMFHVEGRVQSFMHDTHAQSVLFVRDLKLFVRGLYCFPRAIVYLFMCDLSAVHVFLMRIVRTLFL
jgi:hypothetical protein